MEEHPEINDKLKELNAASQKEMQANVIKLVKEYGIELTAEDFKAPQGEVSDDELEAVAGGGGCGCWGGGGGGGDYLDCACVGVGAGNVFYNSEAMSEYGACGCFAIGSGATNWGDDYPG